MAKGLGSLPCRPFGLSWHWIPDRLDDGRLIYTSLAVYRLMLRNDELEFEVKELRGGRP